MIFFLGKSIKRDYKNLAFDDKSSPPPWGEEFLKIPLITGVYIYIYLNNPEGNMIKPSSESNNIRSNIHLILLIPGAGE